MSHLEWFLIASTMLLIVGCLGRFGLRKRPELQDLMWRSILVSMVLSPAVPVLRGWLVERQFSLAILPTAIPAVVDSDRAVQNLSRPPERSVSSSLQLDNQATAGRDGLRGLTHHRSRQNVSTQGDATSVFEEATGDASAAVADAPSLPLRVDHSTSSNGSRSTGRWILIGVWLMGFCYQVLRIALALWNVPRLLRTASPVTEPAVKELVKQCADRIGTCSDVTLACSDRVNGPLVTGLFRPVILVPSSLLASPARNDLRMTLLHELGHVRRHDLAFDLLLRLVTSVLWFHPLVYVMRRELRRLREELCDNFVLAEERPVVYAEVLLRLSVEQRLSETLMVGLGMFARPRRLESRVDSILSDNRALATQITGRVRLWSVIGAIICLWCAIGVRIDRTSVIAQETAESKTGPTDDQSGDEVPPSKGADPSSTNPATAVARTIDVKIVDVSGHPIANAKVKPWGVTIHHGAFGFDEEWSTAVSDSNGLVRISLPPKVEVAAKAMRGANRSVLEDLFAPAPDLIATKANPGGEQTALVDEIGLKVDHPDHPVWSQYLNLRHATKVTLGDGVTIKIRAFRGNEDQLARRLYPRLAHSHSTDWSDEDGVLVYRRVDLSTHPSANWLRVIQVPEHGAAWFSDVVDLNHRSEDVIELDLRLKPGVRVEGILDEQVPRPVKNGFVIAAVVHTGNGHENQSSWMVRADVAADGTFAFESLPPNETLQLIAFSEGWISRSPLQAETADYAAKHQFPRNSRDNPSAGTVLPQLHWLPESTLTTTIRMVPTATCAVTTVDDRGRPVADVDVRFQPNHLIHHWGSSSLGIVNDDSELVRGIFRTGNPDYRPDHSKDVDRFVVKSNAQGVAVISGLPGVEQGTSGIASAIFSANNEAMIGVRDVPSEGTQFFGLPLLTTSLTSGQTERITVRMTSPVIGRSDLKADARDTEAPLPRGETRSKLAGRVQDAVGKPLPGVQLFIDLLMPDLEMPEEVQQMLNRWNQTPMTTDQDGRFSHQFDEPLDCGDEPFLPIRLVKEGYASDIVMMRFDRPNPVVTLHASTSFEGTVRGLDGQPVADAVVRSCHEIRFPQEQDFGPNFWVETRTDQQGRYKLLVKPGQHILMASRAGLGTVWLPKRTAAENVDLAPGRKRTGSERPGLWIAPDENRILDFQLEPSLDFQARAIDSLTGAPLPGVVFVQDEYPDMLGKTDQDGLVVIRSLPAGKLTFTFGVEGYLRAWSDEAATGWKDAILQGAAASTMASVDDGIQFDLKPGMPSVTIAFEPALRLSGQVLDPDGNPVANVRVESFRSSTAGSIRIPGRAGQTDAEGKFTLRSSFVDVDRLRVVAYDNRLRKSSAETNSDTQHPVRWASGVSEPIQASAGEAVADVIVRMTRPGVIRGRAVDPEGRPLAFVKIESTCLDAFEAGYMRSSASTDRKGQFELRDVRPGRHRLYVQANDDTAAPVTALQEVLVNEGETLSAGDVVISRDETAKP